MKLSLVAILSLLFFTATAQQAIPTNIYNFKIPAHGGGAIDLAQYKGKKILMVNTTARDEYSRQYAQLEALYQKYKGKLVIIGFPIEDFATPPGTKRTPISPDKAYPVTFPLSTIVFVSGKDQAPIYHWLTEKKYNDYMDSEVKWDFHKYLINEQGKLVAVFDPKIKADNPKLIAAIEQ